jgi:glutathione S-transferase
VVTMTEAEKNAIHDATGDYDSLFVAVERILTDRLTAAIAQAEDRGRAEVVARVEALADEWGCCCEFLYDNPSRGDCCLAAALRRALTTPETPGGDQ